MPSPSIILTALEPFLNEELFIIFVCLVIIELILIFMRPRRFYFIRHGETLLNAKHIRQGEDGALSERGRAQADVVGRYLEGLHIKQLISSPYPRAKETAEIINSHLHVRVHYSPLLAERRNPSEIIGKSTHDPEVERIVDQMDNAYHDDEYRFSDEENFLDVKERAAKCASFLARQRARRTVVITHHYFLKMFVAYVLYHERLNASDFIKLSFFNVSDNAGVTICEFHPWKVLSATRGWEVTSFNEQLG